MLVALLTGTDDKAGGDLAQRQIRHHAHAHAHRDGEPALAEDQISSRAQMSAADHECVNAQASSRPRECSSSS